MKKVSVKLLLIGAVAFVSCEGDNASEPLTIDREVIVEKEIEVTPDTTFEDGFFVSAEGNFQAKNGSIAYITNDLSTSTNFIYNKVNNNTPLAGLVQSVTFGDENAYIVLNDVNTIVVVDKTTFKQQAIITSGIESPRYLSVLGNKAYVTNWGERENLTDDYIAVINLATNQVESTIPVEAGVERIITKENKLYVSHGAGVKNNIVSVIDTSNANSITTIEVKDGADELFFNSSGELVVLSQGFETFDPTDFSLLEATAGAISFINIATNEVTKQLEMPVGSTASLLAQDGDNLYYFSNGRVFTITAATEVLPSEDQGIETGFIYGMEVNEGKIYTVTFEFSSFSTLNVYDLEEGATIFSSSVGLGASKIYFN